MGYKSIYIRKEGGIATITLLQPFLNHQMAMELKDACQEIRWDKEVWVVVLAGGEDFCYGGEGIESQQGIEAIAHLDLPVLASISGRALGLGLALCLGCDIRIASPDASFGFPDLLSPLGGITQRLPRLIGRGKAFEMLLVGEIINSQEALQIGLINKIADNPLQITLDLARRLAQKAPIALRLAKEAVYKGLDLTLEQGLRLEADLYFLLHTTKDRIEGVRAFLEKRKAKFTGE